MMQNKENAVSVLTKGVEFLFKKNIKLHILKVLEVSSQTNKISSIR